MNIDIITNIWRKNRWKKTIDKLNRLDILNFTNAVLSIADQFESVQTFSPYD